jgi:hypothetical protein
MDNNKNDIPADQKENISQNLSSRRSFLEQAGVAAVLATTFPIQSIAGGNSEQSSSFSLMSEPAEEASSQVKQNIDTEAEAMPLIRIERF